MDKLLFDEWHPVAALDDVEIGQAYYTHLLGTEIRYLRNHDGYVATTADSEAKLLSIQEHYGALWVSFSSDPKPMFKVPEFEEADRRIVNGGSIRVNVSGLRAVENFLDMAHFPYVHTDILGAEPLTEVKPYTVTYHEDVDELIATECVFTQPKVSAVADKPIETEYIYRVARAYTAILYKTCIVDLDRRDVLCLFVQPVSQEWCIAHTIMCYVDDVNTDEQLRRFQQTIFGQDLMILLNQVPKRLPLSPKAENPVRADVLSTAYRRWLRESGLRYGAIVDSGE